MTVRLFDRTLNAFLVRDTVAAILSAEEELQRGFAEADGYDPEEYRIRVFSEKAAPFGEWLEADTEMDRAPIINVKLVSSGYQGGNVIERNRSSIRIHVDCYAVGIAEMRSDGNVSAEDLSMASLQNAVSFARKVLMAGEYTYLGLRGTVGKRWIESEDYQTVDAASPNAISVRGCRLTLVVDAHEDSPQMEGVPLASIRTRLVKSIGGQVLASSLVLAEE
jgi:hypothetical protein